MLVITDDGDIELEVVGLLDESIEVLNRALNDKVETVMNKSYLISMVG
jgi:hypothetical protein